VDLEQVLSMQTILQLQAQSEDVYVHEEIIKAVSNIVRATRTHPEISLGASTRSGIAFLRCLRAYALVKGRSFVIEDDVKDLACPVLEHRLVYRNKEGKLNALNSIIQKEIERLAKLKLTA
jgi:MoxR-like ATPase